MAKKRSTKGKQTGKGNGPGSRATQFTKGCPPGPGAPKLPEDIKAARRELKLVFERVGVQQLMTTEAELKKVTKSKEATALEKSVASIILRAVKADHFRLNFILERLIGRIPVKTTLTDDDGEPASLRVTFPNGEALQIGGLFPKPEGDQ